MSTSNHLTYAQPFNAQHLLVSIDESPGVYVFYQKNGSVLYVGKAVNLKKRLTSYFRSSGLGAKTKLMVSKIAHVETQKTRTENEALLLENNLIKDKHPYYNILLRDDKSFPYIRLNEQDAFPRFTFYRGRRSCSDRYYGPYPNAGAVREMLGQLNKIFHLRQCSDAFFRSRSRPCLQYQIKRCSAPCVGKITQHNYREDIGQAKAMLAGRDFSLINNIAKQMEKASVKLDYETAALYRDRIVLLQRAAANQYVSSGVGDADVVTVAVESDIVCFGVTSIRRGRNLGGRFYIQKNPLGLTLAKSLGVFLPQHYIGMGSNIATEILLSERVDNCASLQQMLTLEKKGKVLVKYRCRAHRARWIEAARINTNDYLCRHLNQRSQTESQLRALATLLSLDALPDCIECFDVSHTMGERTVGACVVFDQRGAIKSAYRSFNITGIDPCDDYAAMAQTLMRRYKRVLKDDGKLPDMIMIDGGKGQLKAAAGVLEELQLIDSVVLLAISKGPERRAGEEHLHLLGSSRVIIPGKSSQALHLVQRIRDEAHRFAITGHRQRRAKARVQSPLQSIEGVGEKRRRELLRYFGGIREVARADVEDLRKAPSISLALAERIYHYFHG